MDNFNSKISRHSVLLGSLLFFIFGLPFLLTTSIGPYLISLSISIILASKYLLLESNNSFFKYTILLSLILTLLLPFIHHTYFFYFTYVFITIVFLITAGMLLSQIATARRVNSLLIVEAIIGYLLLGVILVVINEMIVLYNPMAFSVHNMGFANSIYFSFATLTTIGYGDISPVSQMAKTISIFGGLTGQLYLTIVIAFIVGKFSVNQRK